MARILNFARVPCNMSVDMSGWRAMFSYLKSGIPLIEIRTNQTGMPLAILITAEYIRMEPGSALTFSPELWVEMNQAVAEAQAVVQYVCKNPSTCWEQCRLQGLHPLDCDPVV